MDIHSINVPFVRVEPLHKILIMFALTLVAVFLIIYSLVHGREIVFTHFFYVPIILAAYWYQRNGILYVIALTGFYLISVVLLIPNDLQAFIEATYRAIVFIGIAVIIAYLSVRISWQQGALDKKNKELHVSRDHERESRQYLESLMDNANAPIIVWNSAGIVTRFNYAFEQLTGKDAASVIGTNISSLFPSDREEESGKIIQRMLYGERLNSVEIPIRTRTDEKRTVLWSSAPVLSPDGLTAIAVIAQGQDITGRLKMEEQIRTSLAEKEILLKEIHHRVKNNLQVVASLLDWQSMATPNKVAKGMLQDAQDRVKSIALVHQALYQSKSLDHIDYADYLEKIVQYMYEAYNIEPERIGIRISAQNISMHIDKAVPCSLIVNELISNSFKHAYPGDRTGEIRCEFSQSGDDIRLIYSDNGIGLPEQVTLDRTETLGMRLISGLTRQLRGTVVVSRESGTRFTITFPIRSEADEKEKNIPR